MRAQIKLVVLTLLFFANQLYASGDLPVKRIHKVLEITGGPDHALKMPADIVVTEQDRLYIVDSGHHKIQVHALNGDYLFSFASQGNGPGQLQDPVGIASGANGDILVADRGNYRIQVFDADGKFIRSIPTRYRNIQIPPVDVAESLDGRQLYITGSNPIHAVLVCDNQGKVEKIWGKSGSNEGEFRFPATVAVDRDAEVYVVDVFNSRVQVFSDKGEFLVTIGSWGVLPGQLFRPKGIAVFQDGRTLVSDSYLGVLQLYRSDTRFDSVLSLDGEFTRFTTPTGLSIDRKNRIYVSEMLENRVSVVKLDE